MLSWGLCQQVFGLLVGGCLAGSWLAGSWLARIKGLRVIQMLSQQTGGCGARGWWVGRRLAFV